MTRIGQVVACVLLIAIAYGLIRWIHATEPTAQRAGAVKETAMLVEVVPAERGAFVPEIVVVGTVFVKGPALLLAQLLPAETVGHHGLERELAVARRVPQRETSSVNSAIWLDGRGRGLVDEAVVIDDRRLPNGEPDLIANGQAAGGSNADGEQGNPDVSNLPTPVSRVAPQHPTGCREPAAFRAGHLAQELPDR